MGGSTYAFYSVFSLTMEVSIYALCGVSSLTMNGNTYALYRMFFFTMGVSTYALCRVFSLTMQLSLSGMELAVFTGNLQGEGRPKDPLLHCSLSTEVEGPGKTVPGAKGSRHTADKLYTPIPCHYSFSDDKYSFTTLIFLVMACFVLSYPRCRHSKSLKI